MFFALEFRFSASGPIHFTATTNSYGSFATPFLPVAGHAEAAVNPGVSFTKELLDSPSYLLAWASVGHETCTRLSQHSPRIAGRPGATTLCSRVQLLTSES